MSTHWTRRQTLKTALGGAAAMLGSSRLWAADKTLNILSHRVHQACLTRLALEPPRYCTRCRRRMVVQVHPTGWTARCVEHGLRTSP